jgi:hypothetical protein
MTTSFLPAHKDRMTEDGLMSFAPDPNATLSDRISRLIDSALVLHTKAEYDRTRGSGEGEVARKRIGAGYIGVECARQLAFKYHKWEKEERPEREDDDDKSVGPGELQRHAEAGHWAEKNIAEWLRLAGFNLLTHKRNDDGTPKLDYFGKPKQFGFMNAKDPETGQYRMAGEVDGVIIEAPQKLIPTPTIWESKKATDKKWKRFRNQGVKKADPKYYGQLQTTMAYMEIENVLFTMLNLDNMRFYFELVPFDQATAQALTDRAVMVMLSQHPRELPRVTRDKADFRCRYCDYAAACWGMNT